VPLSRWQINALPTGLFAAGAYFNNFQSNQYTEVVDDDGGPDDKIMNLRYKHDANQVRNKSQQDNNLITNQCQLQRTQGHAVTL
jgi:hypothetical protein